MILLAVAGGGAMGALARYGVTVGVMRWLGVAFPYGTLAVNILGSLLMGMAIGVFAKLLPVSEEMRAFVAIGFLGSFTTFSAFSLDVVNLFQRGETLSVMLYILASVTLSVLALVAGLMLVRLL